MIDKRFHDASSTLNLVTRAGDLDVVVRPAGSDDLRASPIAIDGATILVASLADAIRSMETAVGRPPRAPSTSTSPWAGYAGLIGRSSRPAPAAGPARWSTSRATTKDR
jgi:hypothetical protein